MTIRTLRDVRVGEELCHSYIELCQPAVQRCATWGIRLGSDWDPIGIRLGSDWDQYEWTETGV